MAIAAAVQYSVNIHADATGNIVFDDILVSPFNDGSFGASTAAVTTIVVGDTGQAGSHVNAKFAVLVQYPRLYAGTDPGTLRVNDHIINAFNAIQAVINANPYVGFQGSGTVGPMPVIKTLGSLVGGTNYPTTATGITYDEVGLHGGSGQGAKGEITVNSSGVVTGVVLDNPGVGYLVGDVLTWNLKDGKGNTYPTTRGSGGSITVATIGSPLTNTSYV